MDDPGLRLRRRGGSALLPVQVGDTCGRSAPRGTGAPLARRRSGDDAGRADLVNTSPGASARVMINQACDAVGAALTGLGLTDKKALSS